jgi:hypothetical protein
MTPYRVRKIANVLLEQPNAANFDFANRRLKREHGDAAVKSALLHIMT